MQRLIERLADLLSELKRRKVYRVVILYGISAYAVIELSDIVLPVLGAPDGSMALVLALVVGGLPVAVLLGWMYDLTQSGPQRDQSDRRRDTGPSRAARLATVIGVLIVSGVLGATAWSLGNHEGPDDDAGGTVSSSDLPEGDPRRIAVLYLDDHSEDGSLRHVAAGLTESLIRQLSQASGLVVSPLNAVKQFRDGAIPVDSIFSVLGVGSLVEGSVTREGGTLRAMVQLVSRQTGSPVADQVVEGPMDSIFALQDVLAGSLARALRQDLGAQIRLRRARAGTESQDAWTLYQRGSDLMEWEERLEGKIGVDASHNALIRADSLFAQAAAADPDWIEPLLGRVEVARKLAQLHGSQPGAVDESWAHEAIDRADRIAAQHPGNARVLEQRGWLRLRLATTRGVGMAGGLLDSARTDLERSISIDPERAQPWLILSETLMHQRRFTESLEAANRALDADVFLDMEHSAVHGLFYTFLQFGPFEEAARWCDRGYELWPTDLNFIRCKLLILGTFPQIEPDVSRAWSLFEELLAAASDRSRDSWRLFGGMHVAQTLARAGQRDSALAVLQAIRGDEPPAPAAGHEAKVHALLNDPETAVRMLRLYLTYDPDTTYVAQDWWYEELHDNPRFRALVGLPERSPD